VDERAVDEEAKACGLRPNAPQWERAMATGLRAPLLERAEPLARLEKLWAQAQEEHGLLVLLAGEAGIGKTALVREFVQRVRPSARLLFGSCDALSTPRPLGPVLDMAASLSGELPCALAASGRPEAVFAALFAELSGGRSTILVIEDIHWADAATLDLLRFLSRRLPGTHTLLLVTYRDDAFGPKHPLRITLGDIASNTDVQRITLRPLTQEAVHSLAADTILDPRILYQQTGGNPFFVTEAIASPGSGVPESVRDAVLARIARLDAAARTTLEAAAVIGPTAEIGLLRTVVGPGLSLQPCLETGTLRGEPRSVSFRHELARQAVLSALPPDQRRDWHAKILAALRRTPPQSRDMATLSHHAAGAQEPRAILQFAAAAGRQAAALRSHREAAAQYRRALSCLASARTARRAELLEAYAYQCHLTSQPEEAFRAQHEATRIRGALGDRLHQGDDLRWLSRFNWLDGHNVEAERLAKEAVALLEKLPRGPELAAAYSNQAQLRMNAGDLPGVIRWGRKAIPIARRLRDPVLEAHALNNVGTALMTVSETRGKAELERSLSLARAAGAGYEEHVARALSNLSCMLVTKRRLNEADTFLAEGFAYTTEHDLGFWRLYLSGWRALSELHQGHLAEAARLASETLARPGLSLVQRVNPLSVLGRVRARRGEPEVWTPLDEALALAEQTGELQRLGPVSIARSEAAWLEGDDARARAEAEKCLGSARARRDGWLFGELAVCLRRAGGRVQAPPWCAGPFRESIVGRAATARTSWQRLRCPYEAALALADGGTEEGLRQSFGELEQLGMHAVAARVARRLREAGVRAVPRGRRPSTRAHPAGLTMREAEILRLLGEGLRNADIGKKLFISAKTVDHHVSAILGKLGVNSRAAAARWRPPA
jgi:DNA-binding CsgD family transcriptional regulator/tetratricopeptide (TPR) repeat protein